MSSSRYPNNQGGRPDSPRDNDTRGVMERDRSIPFFNGGDPKSIDLRASMTPAASMDESPHETGGRNLPFAIVSSSGQDEDYPAGELNKGIQGRGWQSSRFCFYPQELVLELQWPSRIINMQLLCHEYKIPSKVEVFVSLTTPWVHTEKAVSQMKRLGYLSLDPNDRSGHQARELKSIHVDAPAAVVRLVLHNCYTNKLNTYSQVGLVALIITGDPLEDNHIMQFKKRGFSALLHTPRIQIPCSKVADTTLNAVDSFTATRIHRLQQEKSLAVQEENYDEAKRLKNLIDKLKGLGEQIKQLELQKRAAVEVEDYDAAKICKLEIEMLRKCDGILAESLSCPMEILECSSNTLHEFRRSKELILGLSEDKSFKKESHLEEDLKNSNFFTVGKESWTQTPEESARKSMQLEKISVSSLPGSAAMHELDDKGVVPSAPTCEIEVGFSDEGHIAATSHSMSTQKEVVPSKQPREVPREPNKGHVSGSHSAPVLAQHNVRHSSAVPEQSGSQMHPASSADDLSAPEPLSEAVRMECAPLLRLLDLHHVQCLYSKQWQLRDKACQFITKLVQSKGLDGDSPSGFRAMELVLIRALNDRVPSIFYCGLQLLRACIVKYAGEISPRDLQLSANEFVNILLDKLGDSNVRSKDAAAETLMFMASKKELGLDVVARPLLRPVKNQASWKPVLGRLNWLMAAIPTFGVQPQSRTGFSSELLMVYVSQAINSPNGEVRNASVKVITEVYKLMGASVERYLKGIKPMIREVLLANFERVALETRNMDDPLTFEELENIPIPKRSRKPAIYDIEKALENDIQKAMSQEVQKSVGSDLELAQPAKRGKEARHGGLHTLVVEQQDRLSNSDDLQTMYSTEATAPVENPSLAPSEETTEQEVVLTELRASHQTCEAQQNYILDADTEASLESLSNHNQDGVDEQYHIEKDDLSDQCLFCGKQDSNFLKEDNLDLHFCQSCPMLVGCCNCKQIVEIASLKDHFLNECTSGRRYVECTKCSQAIPEARMTSHLKSKECRHGKHHKTSRCPLCHHAVQPGDAGWREHLLKPPGCPKNPRTLPNL